MWAGVAASAARAMTESSASRQYYNCKTIHINMHMCAETQGGADGGWGRWGLSYSGRTLESAGENTYSLDIHRDFPRGVQHNVLCNAWLCKCCVSSVCGWQ